MLPDLPIMHQPNSYTSKYLKVKLAGLLGLSLWTEVQLKSAYRWDGLLRTLLSDHEALQDAKQCRMAGLSQPRPVTHQDMRRLQLVPAKG